MFQQKSGVNFIIVLRASFTREDPKCTKRQSSQCIYALVGPARLKAARKMLMKLKPGEWVLRLVTLFSAESQLVSERDQDRIGPWC